jgi:hypothetical protein
MNRLALEITAILSVRQCSSAQAFLRARSYSLQQQQRVSFLRS